MAMYDIAALGELLIDFTPCGLSDTGMKLVEMNPGGAVANVLCAASRLGASTAFIGKVGCDAHGRYLGSKLAGYGIDITGLVTTRESPTTLAFVDIDENGERSFSFFRNPGADTLLRAEELPLPVLERTRVLHVGSLSLTAEPSRSATAEAIGIARAAGALITYDPNYRELLWSSRAEAEEQMRSLLSVVDMIKLSDCETELLTGTPDPERALERLLAQGIKCAVVTLGEDGALVGTAEGAKKINSFPQNAVDTTGAGDSFWGGFLFAMLRSGIDPKNITLENACGFARYGCAVAACCVTKRGAMPAMPDARQVETMLGR